MKKLMIAAALFIATGFSTQLAAATEQHLPAIIQQEFFKNHPGIELQGWEENDAFFAINFLENEKYWREYYTTEGEKIGWSRNIGAFELPAVLFESIQTNYPDYWITELFVIHLNHESTYYLTLENADEKIVLKNEDNSWSTYKSIMK